MLDVPPQSAAAAVTVVCGAAQWLAAPWRDTAVVTLAALGVTLGLAGGAPSPLAATLMLVTGVLLAAAWVRGARRGVGRPGLAGLGLALVLAAALTPWILPDAVPPGPRARLADALVVSCGLFGAVGLPLALERPGPRRRRRVWFRRIPVVEARGVGEGSA